jgi:hypothetical protein
MMNGDQMLGLMMWDFQYKKRRSARRNQDLSCPKVTTRSLIVKAKNSRHQKDRVLITTRADLFFLPPFLTATPRKSKWLEKGGRKKVENENQLSLAFSLSFIVFFFVA